MAAYGIAGPQLESLLENRDEYTAERVFWVPPEARWQNLQNQAARADIATLIDVAILTVERDNPNLQGKLPRDYARRGIAPTTTASAPATDSGARRSNGRSSLFSTAGCPNWGSPEFAARRAGTSFFSAFHARPAGCA